MKKILPLIGLLLTFSCQEERSSISIISSDNSQLTICDESKVGKPRSFNLSELVEDVQIVQLENTEEAFFKLNWVSFSDNYIAIRNEEGPAKLFKKTGEFVGNIGARGRGPGEYHIIYDILIDEDRETIYLTEFIKDRVLKFDLKGKFIEEIEFEEDLMKARLFLNNDSTISLVHLSFKDKKSKFISANFNINSPDSIKYSYLDRLTVNNISKEGAAQGLNNEVFAYKNCNKASFLLTHTDTLYTYDNKLNRVSAKFTLDMDPEKKGNKFFIFDELPNHYRAIIVGKDGGEIVVSKKTNEAFYVNYFNDILGLKTSVMFSNGYYFSSYDPLRLIEVVEEQLNSGDISKDKVEKMKKLIENIDQDGNDIIFYGKLKQ